MGSKGIVRLIGRRIGILLQQEHLATTIRISLSPEPAGDRPLGGQRSSQELLQTNGLFARCSVPLVAACPGCGPVTTSTTFQ
jgi:(E)-4-hydroxy-3-methylbut-2-enyl-diphosphate synthase